MTKHKLDDRTPMPTPADVENVLAGMLAGTSDFAKWLVLVNDGKSSSRDEDWIGRKLFWADAVNPEGVVAGAEGTGGGHTPVEAAAAAWVTQCLMKYPKRLSKRDCEKVPRLVDEG